VYKHEKDTRMLPSRSHSEKKQRKGRRAYPGGSQEA
jgi:hypothetical protein